MRKNTHIKWKLFKSYLKMIQIDDEYIPVKVSTVYIIVLTLTGHKQDKILKYEKKHPYKMEAVQELLEDDPDRRV
ncbi:hypothetical protein NQ318_021785 [Aromia moschata]|uniref:Uncharacterized protein n=1 Tax=Aromia moschata TaxID=1265417 RepID=A0AAV8Z7X1_9CUCU|nr:hypothetical protein NQ318_021785 [Aromia moschata]